MKSAPKETPMLMCGPMVRATLADLKTETRRVVKRNVSGRVERHGKQWHVEDPNAVNASPYGKPGDRLWVKETACFQLCDGKKEKVLHYRADGFELEDSRVWSPSIFMPRWASRITLEITGIRAERVQDITAAGAIAEGIGVDDAQMRETPNFRELWDSLNAKRAEGIYAWAKNPFVWVITFKKL